VYNQDSKQSERDKRKQLVSKEAGIHLVIIPYWWQNSQQFVWSRVAEQRPDLKLVPKEPI
jgi:hypothetical protein